MRPPSLLRSRATLLHTFIAAANAIPLTDACEDSSWLFFGLHLVGVVLGGIASGFHDYYPSTIGKEYVAFAGFYICFAITTLISLYVTYRFSSPDMLLIGTVAVSYLIRHRFPRQWTIQFRALHFEAPMWRTYNRMVFKRMRREPQKYEKLPNQTLQQMRREEHDWNGKAYSSRLGDNTEAIFIEEIDKMHWEKSQGLWKDLMKQARLGVRPAKHAAAALRMAYSIPVPVRICVGTREYYSVRGTKGTEVAKIWGVPQRELEQLKFFTVKHGKRYVECERREDIAMLLHIKLTREDPQQPNNNDEWYRHTIEWLLGEVFVGNLPLPGDVIDNDDENANQESPQMFEQSIHLQNALAYGKVHKCPQGAQQYWYLLNRDDAAQFQLERAPSWHIENAHVTKRHRRPLQSEELQHPSLDGNAFRDELLDGTEIRLEWEAETEYWELTDANWLQLRSTMNEYAGNKDDGGGLSVVKAALRAYRMTRSVPFPVTVCITDEEVAALRQEPVKALSTAWKVPPDDISKMKCLCERDANGAYEFHEEDRLDLAKVLQVKSVLYNEKVEPLQLNCFKNLLNRLATIVHGERESTSEDNFFERKWMLGELLVESEDDEVSPEGMALAYGHMGNDNNRKWFLFSHEVATKIAKKRFSGIESTHVRVGRVRRCFGKL